MPKFRFFLSFLLILFSFYLNAQDFSSVVLIDKPFIAPAMTNSFILNRLEKNNTFLLLNKSEKKFIYWTNYARLFPKEFSDSILFPFLKQQPTTKGSYSASLLKELSNIQPLPFLEPEEKLYEVAKLHTSDLSRNSKRISHQSTNGTSFSDRMKKGNILTCSSENISLGSSDPIVSLLLLYLDIGLPNLGHRKNLMNPNYRNIGVSVVRLKNYQSLIVQDFSCAQ